MKKTIVNAMILSLALAVAASAQTKGRGITLTKDGRQTVAHSASNVTTPTRTNAQPSDLTVISGNLSSEPFGTFFCCFGVTISGPRSDFSLIFAAVPFTPATDVTVFELQAAVGWDGFNPTNKVAMSLAQDSGGLPGTTIKEFHVSNLPLFGDCCGLAVAKHPAGIPLSAGTKYWLVIGTDAHSKFEGGWAFNSSDMRFYDYAQNFGGSWGAITFIEPAYAVLGK